MNVSISYQKVLIGLLVALAFLLAPASSIGALSKNYWLVSSTGQVFAYGHAKNHGSEAGRKFEGKIAGIKGTPNGGGYWIVTSRTHYGFGDTRRYRYRAGGLRKFSGKARPRGLKGRIVGYAVATIPVTKTGVGTQTGTTTTPLPGVDCSHMTILTSSLGQTTATDQYSQTLTAGGVDGGSWSWTVKSGSLPDGLSMSGAGAIAGAPIEGVAGTQSTFVVQATNSQCSSGAATKSFTISVGVPPMSITTQSLDAGTYGVSYSQTMSAGGGQLSDYQWSAIGLPSGLSMSTGGVLSGTPATYGTYTVQISVSDSTGAAPPVSAYLTLKIVLPPLQITSPSSLGDGQATVTYSSVTFIATGGTAMEFPSPDRSSMYVWTATDLPTGMSMSAHGVLSGTPATPGSFHVQVTVADASNNVSPLTQSFDLSVAYAPLGFTTTTLTAIQNQAFNGRTVVHGGEPPYTISLISGSLPPGMYFSAGTIYGTPTGAPGSNTFTVGVSDSQVGPATAEETFNLEIAPSETSPDLAIGTGTANTIWAGYVEEASSAFSSVSGTFSVPTVNASPANDLMPWAGIDGYGTGDLIQAGVTASVDPPAPPTYEAWWATVGPSGSAQDLPIQNQFAVHAADTINVSIWQLSQGQWEITLNDTTSGQGFATTVTYSGADTTAEWIVETPSGSTATGYGATSTFSSLQTSQAGTGMLDLATSGATPGALSSSGFSITDYN